mmetsp:Transcript_16384/g.41576  ORF Transcript_16384/g.41576 Transcript_16384/m.41576 type:complete len:281 (-) Transcript_16384:920-1762(-)|eukprot:CAMPEP_0113871650 /NCGR_PEP_ID=MMETSP0780_2-20120614/2764_1 /TAXON_ID=652834 /ORGANISM="Palpitomonas bilix" /LENGTH=280 /DNA_ID=CAMNT_0000857071 /DNA_START=218 /DNA_END=1060 /DNA_ORIENTATION=+ /assembly_acc=CAM_ASM_000599
MAGSIVESRIGFIGCGKMAQALIGGIKTAGVYAAENILASGGGGKTLEEAKRHLGITACLSNAEVAEKVDVAVLSVKPHILPTVLGEIKEVLQNRNPVPLIVSVAAGVSMDTISQHLGGHDNLRLCRVMPNTPSLVQAGASAYCVNDKATEDDVKTVERILNSVGLSVQVPEAQLAAVTGVSGSGPAYMFLAMEAMADGGVLSGLPRATAMKLAAQTMLGAAKMVLETGVHPGELKDAVTSPAGTTIAAVRELEKNGFRSALIEAVHAASNRAVELGKSS